MRQGRNLVLSELKLRSRLMLVDQPELRSPQWPPSSHCRTSTEAITPSRLDSPSRGMRSTMNKWMLRKPTMHQQWMPTIHLIKHFRDILSAGVVLWMLSSSVHAYPGTEVSSQSPCFEDSTGFIQAGGRKICLGPNQTSTTPSVPTAAETQNVETYPQPDAQTNAELRQ